MSSFIYWNKLNAKPYLKQPCIGALLIGSTRRQLLEK
jgi:hypothetical protein